MSVHAPWVEVSNGNVHREVALAKRVAQEVLGWENGSHSRWWKRKGETKAAVASDIDHDACDVWNPFRNPSADYMVLDWIRTQWDVSDEIAFADFLSLAWRNRAWCEQSGYMVGDYSRAALLVLDSHESRIQESDG